MVEKIAPRIALPPVDQIGVLVKDAEEAANYYFSMFGIGPFALYDIKINKGMSYGKPTAPGRTKIAIARMGLIEFELIQVLEGCEELYGEFLRDQGEGLHHLGIHIKDSDEYDRLLAEFADEGIDCIFSYKGRNLSMAYMDTRDTGGVILELIQMAT